MNEITVTLDKNAPHVAELVNVKVAIFHCFGACMCYRHFVQVDEHEDSPRYSVECERCKFHLSGSELHITTEGSRMLKRHYGKPYLTDDALKVGASRLSESDRWIGRYFPPKGARLVQGGVAL